VKKRILRTIPVILAIVVLMVFNVPAMAAVTDDIDITATPEYLSMTVADGGTNTWAVGAIAESTTVWYTADTNAPAPEPFEDTDMKIILTNNGSIHENVKVHGHDFTGGAHGWVLSEDNTPAAGEVSLRIGGTGTIPRELRLPSYTI
jgi:hypothetical protein